MREMFRLLGAVAAAVALLHSLGSFEPAHAQATPKQVKLTEKQVEGFIAVQKKMATAKAESEFEAIAKEYGFASLDEHDDVEANILMVMDGVDPQTKAFTEPPVLIQRRIDEVTTDKSMTDADKKQALQELKEALKGAKPIQFSGNVELVKKYYEQIQTALE